jgi:predicted ATPase
MVMQDEDLKAIFGDRALDSFPVSREVNQAEKVLQWFEHHFEKQGKDAPDYDITLTYGTVRFIKSACVL